MFDRPDRRALLIRILAALVLAILVAAAWKWTPLRNVLDLRRLADILEPHRRAWYSLPVVILFFVLLTLLLVPVVVPILATGLAFGPWLGALYALIGALASASLGFAFGKRVGPERVERWAGPRLRRLIDKVKGSGPLAVFLLLKTPLPSLITSSAIGAFGVRYVDFLLASMLLRVPLILALDIFEGQLMRLLERPTPGNITVAALFLVLPMILAFRIDRAVKKSRVA